MTQRKFRNVNNDRLPLIESECWFDFGPSRSINWSDCASLYIDRAQCFVWKVMMMRVIVIQYEMWRWTISGAKQRVTGPLWLRRVIVIRKRPTTIDTVHMHNWALRRTSRHEFVARPRHHSDAAECDALEIVRECKPDESFSWTEIANPQSDQIVIWLNIWLTITLRFNYDTKSIN